MLKRSGAAFFSPPPLIFSPSTYSSNVIHSTIHVGTDTSSTLYSSLVFALHDDSVEKKNIIAKRLLLVSVFCLSRSMCFIMAPS